LLTALSLSTSTFCHTGRIYLAIGDVHVVHADGVGLKDWIQWGSGTPGQSGRFVKIVYLRILFYDFGNVM
jgi:hypothetical protein